MKNRDSLSGKSVLVTGGTGSFGSTVVSMLLQNEISEVRVLSRDEQKQDDMRRSFNDERIAFYLGDVRDKDSVRLAMAGVHYVFHAAALKQVPSCEFHPSEAVKTNVIGTENILDAADSENVEKVVCLSTDKAVYPMNAMGMSKALMEKCMIARARKTRSKAIFACTRYGNVMASRGSVIPLFVDQIQRGLPVTVTDPNMTRFMMTLDDAVDLVLYAFENAKPGDIYVQKSPGVTVGILADAVRRLMGRREHPIKIIGTRHGEKLHETLLSREERSTAIDEGDYFRVPSDTRNMNYSKYFDEGTRQISRAQDYSSNTTEQLDLEQTIALLKNLPFMKQHIAT